MRVLLVDDHPLILTALRALGALTLVALALFIVRMIRRERAQPDERDDEQHDDEPCDQQRDGGEDDGCFRHGWLKFTASRGSALLHERPRGRILEDNAASPP